MTTKDISKVEVAKQKSRQLRGTITETLESDANCFGHDDLQLLKFHGTYQQDDRDKRATERKAGRDKYYQFMIRCTLPAGEVTADQYLALDNLAEQYADGSLRITTRQSIQFHGVIKDDLKTTIAGINDALVTTMAACGDVQRNVMACAAPLRTEAHRIVRQVAKDLSRELMPKTQAYHEIWLDGQKISTTEQEDFYGEGYLPRKFKTGVTLDGENSIDVYSYDAGLMGILEGGQLVGFNVLAGGGLGMSHGRSNTFAQLAHELGFVAVADAVAALKVIGTIYRDFGNRKDRKQARLKYLINDMGLDRFSQHFRERADFELLPARETASPHFKDYLGKHTQGDGKFSFGIFVQSGRVKDTRELKIRTALREIVTTIRPGIVLTAQQSILLTDLSEADVSLIEKKLTSYGIPFAEEISAVQRYSMACPALPTCGMAVAESERIAPQVIGEIELELSRLGLRDQTLTFRITGCPNGCARPYTADVALVGRRPGIYHVYVGGRLAGDRVADLFAADVAIEEVVPTLRPLLINWANNRDQQEGLGDFYQRILEREQPRQRITGKEVPTMPLYQISSDSLQEVRR